MAPMVRKFTFDLRFDEPESSWHVSPPPSSLETEAPPPVKEETAPPERLYSEEEMEIAREDSFIAGHTSALEEASQDNTRLLAEALDHCVTVFSTLRPVIEKGQSEIITLATHVALEVCRKVLPHTADHYAAEEINALIMALIPQLASQPRVLIRLHPRIAALIGETILKTAEKTGFPGTLSLIEDETLSPSDTRIEWMDGGAERNSKRLWQQIETLIERNIPHFSKGEAMDIEDTVAPRTTADLSDAAKETQHG